MRIRSREYESEPVRESETLDDRETLGDCDSDALRDRLGDCDFDVVADRDTLIFVGERSEGLLDGLVDEDELGGLLDDVASELLDERDLDTESVEGAAETINTSRNVVETRTQSRVVSATVPAM